MKKNPRIVDDGRKAVRTPDGKLTVGRMTFTPREPQTPAAKPKK